MGITGYSGLKSREAQLLQFPSLAVLGNSFMAAINCLRLGEWGGDGVLLL